MENATTLDACLEKLRGEAAREEATLSAEIESIVKLCHIFANEYEEGPYFGLGELYERVQKRITERLEDRIQGTPLSLGFVPNTTVLYDNVRDGHYGNDEWVVGRETKAFPKQQFSLFGNRQNGKARFNVASLVFPVALGKVSTEHKKGVVVASYDTFTIYSDSKKRDFGLDGCLITYPGIQTSTSGGNKWSRFKSRFHTRMYGDDGEEIFIHADWGNHHYEFISRNNFYDPYNSRWTTMDGQQGAVIYDKHKTWLVEYLKTISPSDRSDFVKLIEKHRRDLASLKKNFSDSFGGVVADYTGAGEKLALHEFEEKAPEAFMRAVERGIKAIASQ